MHLYNIYIYTNDTNDTQGKALFYNMFLGFK